MLKPPTSRRLRGYAFDPSLSLKIDTAAINEIIYKVPWEELNEGPVGEYIEVVDYDPTTATFYTPVDLDDKNILAQDGVEPGDANPQFHQQMVYAVAMTTIHNFEKALGRKILWAPQRVAKSEGYEVYVPKLRIYPHALRDANAFYSPLKKALLFGYFSSSPADETLHMPDSLVFTALSHDIIAHETTHAILDGIYPLYNHGTNPDVLAFHEAFADIVALFQHFSFPDVLKHQIAQTRGDLASQNLLGKLAQEFGSAIGGYGSLRDAIGSINPETKQWEPSVPDPEDYRTLEKPHRRGSILVAAVFEAFINIYKARIADLLRIASNGSGILPAGELHPDLVNRLSEEAARCAGHVLSMCIRALDYCPPMDITFGDFLRAIVTADYDLIQEDPRNYRLAFIDAFRRRGIYPEGIRSLSMDSLRLKDLNIGHALDDKRKNMPVWAKDQSSPDIGFDSETSQLLAIINGFLREYGDIIRYVQSREEIFKITRQYIAGEYRRDSSETTILGLHKRINIKFPNSKDFSKITGLAFINQFRALGIREGSEDNVPRFQIQNLRLVSRVGPGNSMVNQVVFSLVQKCYVRWNKGKLKYYDFSRVAKKKVSPVAEGFTELQGGCTLIFDLDNLCLRYSISKPLLDIDSMDAGKIPSVNIERLNRLLAYQQRQELNEFNGYFGTTTHPVMEPFAFLHQH